MNWTALNCAAASALFSCAQCLRSITINGSDCGEQAKHITPPPPSLHPYLLLPPPPSSLLSSWWLWDWNQTQTYSVTQAEARGSPVTTSESSANFCLGPQTLTRILFRGIPTITHGSQCCLPTAFITDSGCHCAQNDNGYFCYVLSRLAQRTSKNNSNNNTIN